MDVAQSLARVPLVINRQDEPVTDDTLRHLAQEMGDEWQRVAHHLNVKRMRIQVHIAIIIGKSA